MGVPALIREGVSWREVRLRALHGTPVRLAPLESPARAGTNV
jgi:phosphatidylinositol alpha-mannosyltransferase